MRGDGAPRRRCLWSSAHLLCEGAAPFGAPPGHFRPGSFAAFSLLCRAALCPLSASRHLRLAISRRLLGSTAPSPLRTLRRVRRQPAPGRPPDSGAGRSPGTARVRGERSPAPAGAAPAFTSRELPGTRPWKAQMAHLRHPRLPVAPSRSVPRRRPSQEQGGVEYGPRLWLDYDPREENARGAPFAHSRASGHPGRISAGSPLSRGRTGDVAPPRTTPTSRNRGPPRA